MTTEQDIPGDELLEQRVDELVSEIERVSDRHRRAMSDDPDTDELVEQMSAQAVSMEDEPRDASSPDARPEVQAEAPAEAAPDPQAADSDEPEAPPAASLADQMDAMFSGEDGTALADLPEGDIEDAFDEPENADDADAAGAPVHTEGTTPEPQAEPAPDPAAEPVATAETEQIGDPAPPSEAASAVVDASEAEAVASVEALDAELADLADELLDGDFDDVDEVLAEQANAASGFDDSPLDPDDSLQGVLESEPASADETLHETPATEASEDSASEPTTATHNKPAERADAEDDLLDEGDPDEPSPRDAEHPTRDGSTTRDKSQANQASPPVDRPRRAAMSVGGIAATATRRARTLGHAAAELASRPVDKHPAYVRDMVGWFAAVTLFNALAVWIFWFTVRGPGPGDQSSAPIGLNEATPLHDAAPDSDGPSVADGDAYPTDGG